MRIPGIHQDIRTVLAGATCLRFGIATGTGHDRVSVIGKQLWGNLTLIGGAILPAHWILLAVKSRPATALEMDELTQLLANVVSQAGDQAEVIFGHGLNPALGESIQVIMLIS